jgi:plastocyanin
MASRIIVLGSLVVAAFIFQGCTHPENDEGDIELVEIPDAQSFSPDPIEITPGTTVMWHNVDSQTHTSTSDEGLWDSGFMSSGDRYEYTFDEPGEYPYHCELHAFIDEETGECTGQCGMIIVQALP